MRMFYSNLIRLLVLVCIPLFITACGEKPAAPGMKIGKPYQIYGKWYRPAFDPNYSEVGMASWYGPGFHGNYTASGESFNKYDMTAAHTTLPMPSIVRVTNLQNGKTVKVRINDRGPFKSDRIIDLSKKAAQELDMIGTGVAKVKVEYLPEDTERYLVENNIKGREKIIGGSATADLNKKSFQNAQASRSSNVKAQDAAPVASVNGEDLPAIKPYYSIHDNNNRGSIDNQRVEMADALDRTRPQPLIVPERKSGAQIRDVGFVGGGSDSVVTKDVPSLAAGAKVEEVEFVESRPQSSLKSAFDNVDASEIRQPTPLDSYPKVKNVVKAHDSEPYHPPSQPPQPAAIPPPTNSGRYYIQAGTFGSRENAQKLYQKLEGLGSPDLDEVNISGKTMYRVRVGPLSSKQESAEKLEEIHQLGIHDARIVTP